MAGALARLMNGDLVGVPQVLLPDGKGAYRGRRRSVQIELLERHFAGDETWAIQPVVDGLAHLLAWDLDRHGPARIPVLVRILRERGLLKHAVATNGSDPGRGKVLVFIEPTAAATARALVEEILTEAQADPGWGIEHHGHEVDCFPLSGTGGLLRIGGRNMARGGPLERFFDPATGEPMDLCGLERAVVVTAEAGEQRRTTIRTDAPALAHLYFSLGRRLEGRTSREKQDMKRIVKGDKAEVLKTCSEVVLNCPERIVALVADVDLAPLVVVGDDGAQTITYPSTTAWKAAGVAEPNLIVLNRVTGHAHLIWLLSHAVFARTQPRAPRYARRIQRALAKACGATDRGSLSMTAHNPWSPVYETIVVSSERRRLADLAQGLVLEREWTPQFCATNLGEDPVTIPEGTRNQTIFWSVLRAAARIMRRCHSPEEYARALGSEALRFHGFCSAPLDDDEIPHMVRWIAEKFPFRRRDRAAELKAKRHAEGRTWAARVARTNEGRAKAIRLRREGRTIPAIASALGVTTRTVDRYLRSTRQIDAIPPTAIGDSSTVVSSIETRTILAIPIRVNERGGGDAPLRSARPGAECQTVPDAFTPVNRPSPYLETSGGGDPSLDALLERLHIVPQRRSWRTRRRRGGHLDVFEPEQRPALSPALLEALLAAQRANLVVTATANFERSSWCYEVQIDGRRRITSLPRLAAIIRELRACGSGEDDRTVAERIADAMRSQEARRSDDVCDPVSTAIISVAPNQRHRGTGIYEMHNIDLSDDPEVEDPFTRRAI
jgi:hypothetical protein